MGIGGGGGNAVNTMVRSQRMSGVDFMAANTDAQALAVSAAPKRLQLGALLTKGRGAGTLVHVGRHAAQESLTEVQSEIEGAELVFLTAGLGGGTGTGAAPVIAEAVQQSGALAVGIVTTPFGFEGKARMSNAEAGLRELEKVVDTLVIIPNQNLFRGEEESQREAFQRVDQVLCDGVKSITDLIFVPGEINLDFADLCTVMRKGGRALLGTGEAEGEGRAKLAAKNALHNPLFEGMQFRGGTRLLINISGSSNLTMAEVSEIVETIREDLQLHLQANIIYGSTLDETLKDRVRVSFIVTGLVRSYMDEVRNIFKRIW